MHLIVGLGNPGRDYANNRHNIGFMAVDEIASRYGFSSPRSRYQGLVHEGRIGGARVVLLKPMTYVNESGRSVGAAMRFFKLAPADVTVIYDEIDLVAGKVRVKRGGGSAGHNGIRSIDDHIGKDYRRVRLGVGHPGGKAGVHKHVLGNFKKADAAWVNDLLTALTASIPTLLDGAEGEFMNQIAVATKPQRQPSPTPSQSANNTPPVPPAVEARKDTTLGQALWSALRRNRRKD